MSYLHVSYVFPMMRLAVSLHICLLASKTTLDIYSEEGLPLFVKLAALVSETRQVSFYLIIIVLSDLFFSYFSSIDHQSMMIHNT